MSFSLKNPRHIANKGYHGLSWVLNNPLEGLSKRKQRPIPIYIPECMVKP
jgi:hypothetical protein